MTTFRLISRLSHLVMIKPSRYVHKGESAHNTDLKRIALEQIGAEGFYNGFYHNWCAQRDGLRKIGCHVTVFDLFKGPKSADDTFAQDLLLCDDNFLISAVKTGAKSRRRGRRIFEKLFKDDVPKEYLQGKVDFGDMIFLETEETKLIIIGRRNNDQYEEFTEKEEKLRTSPEAIDSLCTLAEEKGYKVVIVDHNALHLTTAITSAGQAKENEPIVFLYNNHLIDCAKTISDIAQALGVSENKIKFICTEITEGSDRDKAIARWSASCIGHNGKVLVQEGCPVIDELRALGFEVIVIPFFFVMLGDGGMTCLIFEKMKGVLFKKRFWNKAIQHKADTETEKASSKRLVKKITQKKKAIRG